MHRWMASAAGGISHRLYPGEATECSRSRNVSAATARLLWLRISRSLRWVDPPSPGGQACLPHRSDTAPRTVSSRDAERQLRIRRDRAWPVKICVTCDVRPNEVFDLAITDVYQPGLRPTVQVDESGVLLRKLTYDEKWRRLVMTLRTIAGGGGRWWGG